MTWSKELPTKPGLYAWCDGRGGAVEMRCVFLPAHLLLSWVHLRNVKNDMAGKRFVSAGGGLWQPLTVELPPAYVPPKPPKVEVYSAKSIAGGVPLWLFVLGSECHAIIVNNGGSYGTCRAKEKGLHYTNIERVPDEN